MLTTVDRPDTRYSYGGDEFILVEFDQGMSLETNLIVQRVAARVELAQIDGVSDVCPANLSYLVRFDPDEVAGDDLIAKLRSIEASALSRATDPFATRIVDVPVLFQDPWTHEVVMKFRDRVQDPSASDIEYLTRINNLASPDEFIGALTSTPHMVTMTGFVPGVVWSYQLVTSDRQLQGPKYLRPRTETPDRAFALGGAFTAIYPAPSSGGYPIFGRAAAPVYDPSLTLPDFEESAAFVRLGDIYNYRPVDRDEYDLIQKKVADKTFRYRIEKIEFDPAVLMEDPDSYCSMLVDEVLYA